MEISVQITSEAAQQLVKMFYDDLDNKRYDRLVNYYNPASTIIWNGRRIAGPEIVNTIYQFAPSFRHEIQSFDAQPIASDSQGSFKGILISVTGKCTLSKNSVHHFHHIFIIPWDTQNNRNYILSEVYRWTD